MRADLEEALATGAPGVWRADGVLPDGQVLTVLEFYREVDEATKLELVPADLDV